MADVVYSFVAAVYLVGFLIIYLFSVCSIWLVFVTLFIYLFIFLVIILV